MATWSGIRKKLESEYLAKSLQEHIQYYATTYSRSHDHEGRAAIRYDGKEIIKGCYWYNWTKAGQFPKDEKYERRMREENAFMDDTALKLGVFDQRSFYAAFQEFDQQSIEKSLKSENLIVRIFAVLDRRVGKRRLLMMKDTIEQEPNTFKEFYAIRARAEGIKL
ncbi:SF0329 family protein [Peptostreptococcus stomatis]|uniref:SF0329 family protein n=1 Tax=Peptostreptococcus stomatis TaxID=341694 RepID=UPI003FA13075